MERAARVRRRALRGPRRLERRGRLHVARAEREACRRDRRLGRRVAPRQARAARLEPRRPRADRRRRSADGATLELGTRDARRRRVVAAADRRARASSSASRPRCPGLRERLEEAAPAASGDGQRRRRDVQVRGDDARRPARARGLRPLQRRSTCARRSRRSRGFRPGSIARTPGMLVREGEERFLFLFGCGARRRTCGRRWPTRARTSAGRPSGLDALDEVAIGIAPVREEAGRA